MKLITVNTDMTIHICLLILNFIREQLLQEYIIILYRNFLNIFISIFKLEERKVEIE